MSSEDIVIIDNLTEQIKETLGTQRGIAVLASVICCLYEETSKETAIILAQPHSQNVVITTTLDACDQIPSIIEETIRQLTEAVDAMEDEEIEKVEGIYTTDGDTGKDTTFEELEKATAKKRTIH